MNTFLTVVAFALFCAFLYVLGSSVPRPDLLAVLGATVALALWDLFFHDRVRMRRAKRTPAESPADADADADGPALAPELDEPGTVRDDGRRVEGLEK